MIRVWTRCLLKKMRTKKGGNRLKEGGNKTRRRKMRKKSGKEIRKCRQSEDKVYLQAVETLVEVDGEVAGNDLLSGGLLGSLGLGHCGNNISTIPWNLTLTMHHVFICAYLQWNFQQNPKKTQWRDWTD